MAGLLTVLLNWRSAEMTLRAAEAALAALDGIAGALVIVDNDSGDGSFEAMRAEVRNAAGIRGRRRCGCCNRGTMVALARATTLASAPECRTAAHQSLFIS